ncbi:hypothetical protein [Alistipes sp.]|uniref:hypothetical protein n=1 Tax=Alistipes sp. TaxID=1872444 RepID=UPI003A8C60A2
MINKKDRLSYLMLAQLVQQYAAPHVREGKLSLWQIFINHVHDKVPVTLNTFRKMMKEDVSDLDAKIEAQRRRLEEQHDKMLEKKRRNRIRKK